MHTHKQTHTNAKPIVFSLGVISISTPWKNVTNHKFSDAFINKNAYFQRFSNIHIFSVKYAYSKYAYGIIREFIQIVLVFKFDVICVESMNI